MKNEWTKKIGESLARYRPREYPVLKEAKSRLVADDTSPARYADTVDGPSRRELPAEAVAAAQPAPAVYNGLGTVAEYGQGWVLANLRLRFPSGRWVPYVYAGTGITYTEFKDYQPASADLDLEGDTLHPAVNVGGGVEYFITRNFSLNADARWAYTWSHGFGIENYLRKTSGDYSIVAATIGFRVYLFNL